MKMAEILDKSIILEKSLDKSQIFLCVLNSELGINRIK